MNTGREEGREEEREEMRERERERERVGGREEYKFAGMRGGKVEGERWVRGTREGNEDERMEGGWESGREVGNQG